MTLRSTFGKRWMMSFIVYLKVRSSSSVKISMDISKPRYDRMHEGFGYGERNSRGASILDNDDCQLTF